MSAKKSLPTAREIVRLACNGRLCDRPEFYSGRGPAECDLNSRMLSELHSFLKEADPDIAHEFVLMIENQKDMSATAFLNEFYRFEGNGWKYVEKTYANTSEGIDVGPDDGKGTREVIAMATVMDLFGGGRRSNWRAVDHLQIKGHFLSLHGFFGCDTRNHDAGVSYYDE